MLSLQLFVFTLMVYYYSYATIRVLFVVYYTPHTVPYINKLKVYLANWLAASPISVISYV